MILVPLWMKTKCDKKLVDICLLYLELDYETDSFFVIVFTFLLFNNQINKTNQTEPKFSKLKLGRNFFCFDFGV